MTNLGRGGDGTSPDSPKVQYTGAWPRNDMHLQYQQSDRDADTRINNYYNTQQDEYPEALGFLYDNLDEFLNMEEFDTADHTASNIDPNLMANGSYNPYLSSPPPGPQFGQPLQHAVSAPAPLGSTQNSYTSHVQNQGAVSSPGYYSAPAHSHINTGISTAQFANLPRSDQIRILAEFRHAQHELQNRSHRLPPSGQHGMWQPSSNINSSNFTSPPQHSLHPSIDRITQHIHHTWDGQEHRAFMGNENLHSVSQHPYHDVQNNTGGFGDFVNQPRSPHSATPSTLATASSPGFRSLSGPSTARRTGEKTLCAENPCTRGARPGSNYCKRHQEKWDRNNATAPQIPYIQGWTFDLAMSQLVYPTYPDKALPHEKAEAVAHEDHWVQRFLRALETPTQQAEPNADKFYIEQQKKFNGVALMESRPGGRYSPLWINARMRMLFHSVIVLHFGGKVVYPIGGDNGGYGKPDLNLTFEERLSQLEGVLMKNKLIAGDVIEGRGVMALVENPEKYEKRKSQNKQSNLKKDEVLEAERKRQRSAVVDEDDEDEDDGQMLSSLRTKSAGKRRKPTPTMPQVPETRLTTRLRSQTKSETPASQVTGSEQLACSPVPASDPVLMPDPVAADAKPHVHQGDLTESPNVEDWDLNLDAPHGL